MALDKGTLADLQLLGMEADAAAAVSLDGNQIKVDTPRPHLFDGVDLTVSASNDAKLTVEMKAGADGTPVKADVPLADALRKPFRLTLDNRGSELVIQRAPNDGLRIITHRDSLIFSPGEQFTFDVQPVLEEIEPGTTIDIEATMTVGRGGNSVWHNEQKLPVPINGPPVATLHVPLPIDEGVYQFHIAVLRPAGFRDRFFRRCEQAACRTHIPSRRAEPHSSTAGAGWPLAIGAGDRSGQPTVVGATAGVDTSPSHSWAIAKAARQHRCQFRWAISSSCRRRPRRDGEPNWQAYPLPVEADGTPHMLEIEYPNDQEQHLGISILEPNAAGKLVPVSRDSGVFVEGLGRAERVEKHKHRIVFWPRTNAPLLLVTNLHPTASGRFGHIRVLKRTNGTIAASGRRRRGRSIDCWPRTLRGRWCRKRLARVKASIRRLVKIRASTIRRRSTTARRGWPTTSALPDTTRRPSACWPMAVRSIRVHGYLPRRCTTQR